MPASTVNKETARSEAEYALNRKQHEKGVFLSTEQQKMVLEFAREISSLTWDASRNRAYFIRDLIVEEHPDKETYLTNLFADERNR